jgi:hypothetical protein
MRKIFILLLTTVAITAQAQLSTRGNIVNSPSTANSRYFNNADLPVIQDKYPKFANGTPYFLEDWVSGDILLVTGEKYENVKMRLDLVENSLQYIGPDGRELVLASPVKSITLRDSTNGKEYKFAHSSYLTGTTNADPGWYQVLASGTATLYKHIQKTIVEPKNYSSGMTEPSVNTQEDYFIYNDWTLSRFKKIKEIPVLLKDKTDELNQYITTKKLSGRSEKDYITLVEYYNNPVQPKAF